MPKKAPRRFRILRRVGSVAGVTGGLLLVACVYEGAIDSPATQKFTWFSYVSGDDIRADCEPGSPETYRFVYNARYDEQIRSYEVLVDEAEGSASITARAQGKASISTLRLDDILAPWRWKKAQSRLDGQEMSQLREALAEAGFYGRPEVGLELNSKAFYWAVVGCIEGNFYYGGWQDPAASFKDLRFPAMLLDQDGTGLAVNPPRPLDPIELGRSNGPAQDRGGDIPRFLITVGEDGLEGGGLGLRDPF
ncbi:MAG: hypothetical protein QNJ30_26080 [Kiloniellales bacterium]|nr:hypothetical protein [Kiloniellales bacterium]